MCLVFVNSSWCAYHPSFLGHVETPAHHNNETNFKRGWIYLILSPVGEQLQAMGCESCLSKMFLKKRGEQGKLKDSKDRTPLKQRISFGTGHIFNDLCSAVWFTYFIVYFNKVVGLSSKQTGLLFLIAQSADAILTPFTGIGCDRFVIKPFSRYGKRKSWHLFGTIAQAIIWPFILSPCLVCSSDSPSWLPMLYYAVGVILLHVGSPAVEFAHLSLIPEIAKRTTEIVELTAVR